MMTIGLVILAFGVFLLTVVVIPSGNRLILLSRFPQLHTLDSLLRYRDFRLLWTGNFCANSAQWFQLLTVGWLVRELSLGSSNSALQVVAVGGISSLPVLLVGPWGGVLGDRIERRKLMMVTNGFMATGAVLFALLVYSGLAQVWHAYAYVLLSGAGLAITQPTRQSLVANTVPREAFGNAFATNTFTIGGTRMIGPFFGGLVIANLGFTWNFLVEAALYVSTVLVLLPMKTPYQISPPASAPSRQTARRMSPLADLTEGIRYVWGGERAIFQLMLLGLVSNVVMQPVMFMLPLYTAEVLVRGADVGGYLLAATGFGALVAAVTVASVGFVFKKGTLALGSVVVSAIVTIMFAHSPWLIPAICLIALSAAALNATRTANGTMVQLLVPDRLRTRITGLGNYFMGFVVFSSLLTGWFAGVTSVTIAITAVGGVGLTLGVAAWVTLRRVRIID